jgi:Hemagglutinin repeat
MQALGAATAALQAQDIARQAGQLGDALASGADPSKAADMSVSISLGASKSQSNSSQSSDSARGSSVAAGGNIHISASGAGTQGEGRSDITIQGSSIQAGGTTRLSAEDDINLLAAANTTTETNSSKSSSGSIGVNISGAGISATASASRGQGQGAGNSTTHTNTQVSGQRVQIESGGDTTLKGAVVSATQVTAQVGGNLSIESLQDSSRYNESSQSAGFSVSVPITGGNAGASVSAGKTQINSNYQSVGEQSAIRAGDGGFQVSVAGNTTLTGGQITSTEQAVQENRNSFSTGGTLTTSDLQNSARYEASGVSVGVGFSRSPVKDSQGNLKTNADGTPQTQTTPSHGIGFGSTDASASSSTTAGISAMAGDAAARTTDPETGLAPIFDKDQATGEVNAQIAITQEAGKRLPKFIGDEMAQQRQALKAQAENETDPDKKAALLAEAKRYEEGGVYHFAAHAALGALAGGASGAVGAAASSAAAPTLQDIQSQLQTALQDAGMSAETSQALASLSTGALAATLGAVASGGTTAGAAAAFNADMNNRQLHPTEAKLIKDNARRFASQLYGTEQPTAEQIEAAQALLANTAQNQLDNNPGVIVPYNEEANAFLQTLKIEYHQANGTLTLPGTSGQPTGAQQLFYANTEQKNMPWLNQGLADQAVTGLIVRTPINPPKAGEPVDASRDRLTGLALDEKDRYEVQVLIDGEAFAPKFYPCATAECLRVGGNLDMSDPATQAYVRALDQQVFKDIGTAATWASLVTPVGVPGAVLTGVGVVTAVGSAAVSDSPVGALGDEVMKEASEAGAIRFFEQVLGHTPATAARGAALINLSGGWDAFTERVKVDLFGVKPDASKK